MWGSTPSRVLICAAVLVVSIIPRNVEAEIRLLDAFSGAETDQSWASSTFLYYGPAKATVTGPALFLSIDQTCNPLARSEPVAGRIVVSANRGGSGYVQCLLDDVYAELSANGALAYINTEAWPTGFNAFRHGSWDACRFCGHEMTLASVYDPEGTLFEMRGAGGEVLLEVRPPHDSSYADGFRSAAWIIVFRILLPAFALGTCTCALRQVERKKDEESKK